MIMCNIDWCILPRYLIEQNVSNFVFDLSGMLNQLCRMFLSENKNNSNLTPAVFDFVGVRKIDICTKF